MSINQRMRSATCWAVSLLWKKRSVRRKKNMRGIEGDLGPIAAEGHTGMWRVLVATLKVTGLKMENCWPL